MKITQEVRDYAAGLEKIDSVELATADLEREMQAKAEEFKAQGSQLYHKV